MRVLDVGRKKGKTTRLLQWVSESEPGTARVFVSRTRNEAMDLLVIARNRGLDVQSWQFVGWEELKAPRLWMMAKERIVLGIDNLDLIVQDMVRWPIELVTLCGSQVWDDEKGAWIDEAQDRAIEWIDLLDATRMVVDLEKGGET